MYEPFFNIKFIHQYYDDLPAFNMKCSWFSGLEKLINDMDLKIVTRRDGVTILFNRTRFSKNELLDLWDRETLIFHLSPEHPEIFYRVTSDLENILGGRGGSESGTKEKYIRCFQYLESSIEPELGKDLCLTEIQTATDFDELVKILSAQLKTPSESEFRKSRQNADIKELTQLIARQPTFLALISTFELSKSIQHENTLPTLSIKFNATSAHYKYYFTNIEADESLKIVGEDEQAFDHISYSRVAAPEVKSGNAYISNEPIFLRRQHDKYFKLIKQVKGASQTIIAKLPHPEPDSGYKHIVPNQAPIKVLEAFIH